MAQIREIKKRMVAVRTIQRITKTMQMIATAKFTAALQRAKATRPYTERIRELVSEVSAASGDVDNPLLGGRSGGLGKSVSKEILLVVTSDRGLCGAYNGSVLRSSMNEIRKRRAAKCEVIVETAGKKGLAFFRFQKMDIAERHSFGDKPVFADVAALADRYMADFIAGKISAVYVSYMRFISASRQVPEVMQLLPLTVAVETAGKTAQTTPAEKGSATVYDFRPSAEALLNDLLPKSVKVSLFQALNDSVVSENVMRMVAMKAATDNASGLGRTLKRNFNRARQAKITTELTEIISGAAALE
ncbi:MAG: ATP synthase F1 subunit gamma [Planctomycetota bacterium]|nr:ATP synthase F1 subunit gamma [Planctomycetota bacterium]MDA1263011.1 ATP synthase F1 subunit gamma [Planctomycetota bacterium]